MYGGFFVGLSVGSGVKGGVGSDVGGYDGNGVGALVGAAVGVDVGGGVGYGETVGIGETVGSGDDSGDGACVGWLVVGFGVGYAVDGRGVGVGVGTKVGFGVTVGSDVRSSPVNHQPDDGCRLQRISYGGHVSVPENAENEISSPSASHVTVSSSSACLLGAASAGRMDRIRVVPARVSRCMWQTAARAEPFQAETGRA